MVILGIDPGLAHTGWGVVETRGPVCRARAYGSVETRSHESIDSRLGRIYDEVKAVIERYGPTELAIENVYFGENVKSAVATAQARGAAIVACAKAGLSVGEYTPMQIKQAVVGYGKAEKRQVMDMTKRILHLSAVPKPDDAADAVAIALCHARSHTSRLTRFGL